MTVGDDINKSGDDADKKHDDIGSSFELNLSFGDTLYLHPNDTSGSPIVTIKLTGTKNYKIWSIAMTFALRNHNKIGFIKGSCKRDNKNPTLTNQRDMCNSIVVTWIMTSLSPNLFAGAIYAKTAFKMWSDLKEAYDKFDAMISLPPCACEAAKHFRKHNQLIKLMQFLMDLDENYLAIRSNILTKEPLPLVKAAFTVVSGEESYRNVTVGATKPTATAFVAKTFNNKRRPNNNNNFNKGSSSNSNSNNKGPNPNLKCINCNKIDHTVDRCFELVGYPVGYVKRNFNANTRPISSNNASADVHSNNVSSNNATASNSLVSLSNEQLARLMNLLNDNGVPTVNANMADLKAHRTVGIDNQCNGLYLFDVDKSFPDTLKTALNLDSHSTSDHLCDIVINQSKLENLFN
ncbi:ribonuclease H-like domain-containing protein [Tanacetum coccineum]